MSSGQRKAAAPPPPQGGGVDFKQIRKDSAGSIGEPDELPYTNGNGPPSITYSNSTDGDENMNDISDSSIVDLLVILPSGKTSAMEVDANIPMIDLLVHLAGRAKLNPASHKLVVLNEDNGRTIDYKANQSIGSLGISTIHLIDKKAVSEKNKRNTYVHPVTNKEQPFEMTYRLTINLPRNQKSVIRINPKVQLHQLYRNVCEDKNLDPDKYTFQHPAKPDHPLDPRMTVGDLNSNEINLVPANTSKASAKRSQSFVTPVSDNAQSMPDLRRSESSRVATTPQGTPQYMPGGSSEKKKSRIFSFFKKEKKYKPSGASFSETPPPSSQAAKPAGGSPPLRRSAEKGKDRPKTMYAAMPAEVNGHLQTRSTSNGQLPQDTGATPKVLQSQTLQRPAKQSQAVTSSPPGEIASHTLPKPANKSPAKGYGKKRPAPPPPQMPPAPSAQQSPPAVIPPQPTQSAPSLPTPPARSSTPPLATSTQVSSSPRLQDSPPSLKSPEMSSSLDRIDHIASASTPVEAGPSKEPDVSVTVNQSEDNKANNVPKAEVSTSGVSTTSEISVNVESGVNKRPHEHSRTSSDSSGYHEATLSGPESPEANRPLSLSYNKDTSMDTASIESAENVAIGTSEKTAPIAAPVSTALNIPSLRSQMRNRDDDSNVNEPVIPDDYVTLPRKHVDKKAKEAREREKEGLSRSHSMEKQTKAAAPPRRKKAPAPPPPQQGSPRNNTSVTSLKSEVAVGVSDSPSEPRIAEQQQSSLETSAELSTSETDKGVTSPKLEVNGQRQSRAQPPLFIPPPPPDTPPPPETPPILSENSVSLNVETEAIDNCIGTEEISSTLSAPNNLNDSRTSNEMQMDISATSDKSDDASVNVKVEEDNAFVTEKEALATVKASDITKPSEEELNTSITSDHSSASKSSPSTSQSRCESRTSKTSVSTIDDVNLAFDETIALGEEVWGKSLEDATIENEVTKQFPSSRELAKDSPRSFDDSFEDVKEKELEAPSQQASDTVVMREKKIDDLNAAQRDVSEITYDFKIDSAPPGFTGETNSRQSMSSEEEVTIIEEEVVFVAPKELIKIYEDDAKIEREWEKDFTRRVANSIKSLESTIPDWDTSSNENIVRAKMVMVEPGSREESPPVNRKEIKPVETIQSVPPKFEPVIKSPELTSQIKTVSPRDRKRNSLLEYARKESMLRNKRITEPAREKEEFVISKSDLNRLDFLGGRKPKKPFVRPIILDSPKPLEIKQVHPEQRPKSPQIVSPDPKPAVPKLSKSFLVPKPYKQPSGFSSTESSPIAGVSHVRSSNETNVRSDYNFVPPNESETENVLEEKSISMINLPATRVSASQRVTESFESKQPERVVSQRQAETFQSQQSEKEASAFVNSEKSSPSQASLPNLNEQQNLMNAQYNQLQDQFAMWQQQLVQNQALLAQHQIMPEDQSQQLQQLQLQLQLQQQMMEQLQQSMQALALQGAVTVPVKPVQASAAAPPVAPPPPAPVSPVAAPVVKSELKPSKSKNKKRFERQLDPREELMLAIRQASGRNCLKKVTVKEARWTNKPGSGDQY